VYGISRIVPKKRKCHCLNLFRRAEGLATSLSAEEEQNYTFLTAGKEEKGEEGGGEARTGSMEDPPRENRSTGDSYHLGDRERSGA